MPLGFGMQEGLHRAAAKWQAPAGYLTALSPPFHETEIRQGPRLPEAPLSPRKLGWRQAIKSLFWLIQQTKSHDAPFSPPTPWREAGDQITPGHWPTCPVPTAAQSQYGTRAGRCTPTPLSLSVLSVPTGSSHTQLHGCCPWRK